MAGIAVTTWATTAAAARSVLLRPLWWLALALLAINDHLLKGAGWLPGAVTGKLSDLAGLVVAPPLLAAIVGAGSVRGRLACHAAVGGVFAAIQLSPALAQAWSTAMAALGVPWTVVPDPTDLLALPALAVSWRLRPVTPPTQRLAWRRLAETNAATVGLLACLGTSPVPPPVVAADFTGDLWISNATDEGIVVRVRLPDNDVAFDCAALEGDLGGLLRSPLFTQGHGVRLLPTQNYPIRGLPWDLWDPETGEDALADRECWAALVETDTLAPRLVAWRSSDWPEHTIQGNTYDPADSGPGALVLRGSADDLELDDLGEGLVHDVPPEPDGGAGACKFQPDAGRLAWSTPLPPTAAFVLDAVEAGVDGCTALRWSTGHWYVCLDPALIPFAAGDLLRVTQVTGVSLGLETLRVARLTAGTDTPDGTELVLSRGDALPALWTLASTLQVGCDPAAEDACGTAAASASLRVAGDNGAPLELDPGESGSVTLADGTRHDVLLAHAQERIALDPACAAGPDTVGSDVEVAATRIPALP